MSELFQTTKQNISLHLKNIFAEGELLEDSVVKDYLTTATDGKKYRVRLYNLEAIIAIGYRVKSHRGTQFRQWATERLKEFMVKGFTMDDERLAEPGGVDYFDELLERIRAIRASEKRFYQKVRDIYQTSVDYDPKNPMTQEFFAIVQNKMIFAATGKTAAELIKNRAAYARRANSDKPYPDFRDVYEIARTAYEEEGKRDDSLIEVLRDLSDFNLFWAHGSELPPIEKLSDRSLLIDVHAMPVLKELVAYLVIERLYKEMSVMPDSPINDNKRTIRTILVIDEAHNYLGQKNIFLQRIIREGRSKGIVVFFASQSPNDYQQKFFNFQELLEFAYIFQCEGVSASSIQEILGCSPKTAKDLQTEVARLEPWQVISRSPDKKDEFVKFTAEAFYRNH